MKTLIIHPKDPSTDFLSYIYKNIDKENSTLVTGGLTVKEVNKLIESHDRIMMMGHGSPYGLFSTGQFKGISGYVINENTVPLLKEKQNIAIWCHANKFMDRYKLKGLYSGMFVSEVGEAEYEDLPNTPQHVVNESNDSFANFLGDSLNESLQESYIGMMKPYKVLSLYNPVALFNYNRLYLNL
jgi:hypothetical protein